MCRESTDSIASKINRSKEVVWTSIQATEKYEKEKCDGRPPKVSPAERRPLLRETHEVEKSAGQLCNALDLTTGKKGVHRIYVQAVILFSRSSNGLQALQNPTKSKN